jgi:TRAP-type C4-dicarboxylate transport system permease large subunit
VVVSLGFDPIWFGVLLILLIEMALITPPVGLNLYVVQGIRHRGSISEVMIGSIPFVIMIGLMIVAMVIFPEMALYLAKLVN